MTDSHCVTQVYARKTCRYVRLQCQNERASHAQNEL